MKRIISLAICILLIISAFPAAVYAAESMSENIEEPAVQIAEETEPEDEPAVAVEKAELADTGAEVDVAETGWKLLSEAQFQSKMAEVQAQYPDGGLYGGVYYEDGYAKAWTCWGYACQMLYEFFGAQFYNDGLFEYQDYNVDDLCAGDWVRITWSHSIFITKVTDAGVYYTDGNGDGANGIRWNGFYSWDEMYSIFSFRIHLPGNNLKGSDPVHTVAYNANGGTGSISSVNYKTNEPFTIAQNVFSKDSESFAGFAAKRSSDNKWFTNGYGWQSQSDIRDKGYTYRLYYPGENYKVSSAWLSNVSASTTLTFYAQWIPDNSVVEFIDNYSGYNYLLGSDFENGFKSYIYSRDNGNYTVSLDTKERYNNQPSLKIVGKSAGKSGSDLAFRTTTNAGYGDGYSTATVQGDSKDMTLHICIKSPTDGAKFYIRWGYQSTGAYSSVTLSKGWNTYSIPVSKTAHFGSSLHPYFDKAGTYYINSVSLADGTENTGILPESGDHAAGSVTVARGTSIGNLPVPERDGYSFLGWYTAAQGGEKVTPDTKINAASLRLYARWKLTTVPAPVKTVTSNDQLYELYDAAMTWEEAESFCEQKGGHLVTINSFYENNLVYNMINDRPGYCWLGLSYDKSSKSWKWANGEMYTFNYWYHSSFGTNDSGEHYAMMYSANPDGTPAASTWGKVNPEHLYSTYKGVNHSFFICEYETAPFIGDADGNGEVDEIDVVMILRYQVGIPTGLSTENIMNGDIDNSGDPDIVDATFIQRWLSDISTPYPIGKRKG